MDVGVARERRTTDLRAPRVFLTNVKLLEMNGSLGYVSSIAEAVFLSFVKEKPVVPIMLGKEAYALVAEFLLNLLQKSMLFLNNYIHFDVFLSRIYMFDSRSWLSTVVRENVSRRMR